MSNDDVAHIGNRSWWDGTVKTLCGRRIEKPNRVWLPRLSGRTICPACVTVDKAR